LRAVDLIGLRLLAGPELQKEIRVEGPRFLIGRAEDCHLRLSCPMVSRHHCELIVEPGRLSVRDINGKNGTYVNGQQVTADRQLQSGDLLDVGLRRLAVEIAEVSAPLEALEAGPALEALPTSA
jgi:pSer/pThr/pTyr-binding forkhead associated (FHA) protein